MEDVRQKTQDVSTDILLQANGNVLAEIDTEVTPTKIKQTFRKPEEIIKEIRSRLDKELDYLTREYPQLVPKECTAPRAGMTSNTSMLRQAQQSTPLQPPQSPFINGEALREMLSRYNDNNSKFFTAVHQEIEKNMNRFAVRVWFDEADNTGSKPEVEVIQLGDSGYRAMVGKAVCKRKGWLAALIGAWFNYYKMQFAAFRTDTA